MFFFGLWIVVQSQSRTQMSLGDLDTVAYEVTVQLISLCVSSTYSRDMGQVPKQVTKQYRHVAPLPPFAPGRNREERERERKGGPPVLARAHNTHARTICFHHRGHIGSTQQGNEIDLISLHRQRRRRVAGTQTPNCFCFFVFRFLPSPAPTFLSN